MEFTLRQLLASQEEIALHLEQLSLGGINYCQPVWPAGNSRERVMQPQPMVQNGRAWNSCTGHMVVSQWHRRILMEVRVILEKSTYCSRSPVLHLCLKIMMQTVFKQIVWCVIYDAFTGARKEIVQRRALGELICAKIFRTTGLFLIKFITRLLSSPKDYSSVISP